MAGGGVSKDFRLPISGNLLARAVRSERPFVKDQEAVQKFIELRSQGLSYARIAAQIDVARSTLVNWSRQHQHLIQNLRTIDWEEFLDRTLASKQERVQALSDQLRRLETEMAARELGSIPTPRLLSMAEQLRRRLDRECGTIQFTAGVELSRDDDTREAVQGWNA
jgi:transposase-like protein